MFTLEVSMKMSQHIKGLLMSWFSTKTPAEVIQAKLIKGYQPKNNTKLNTKQLNELFGKAVKEYNSTHDKKITL